MVGSYVMKGLGERAGFHPGERLVLAGRLIGCSSSISVIAW